MRNIVAGLAVGVVFLGLSRAENPYASVPHEESVSWCRLAPVPFSEKLDLPVGFVHLPDGTSVVACQKGMFYRVDFRDPTREVSVFLDLREKLAHWQYFEEGVHGIALHPDFAQNGRLFLCYSVDQPQRSVLTEMSVDVANDFTTLPETEKVLLEHRQPMAEHWGGQILFGPDRMLYVGFGDGGIRNDPYRLGQILWTLHAKLLRLDIDRAEGGLAYAIPPDNPFVNDKKIRHEIYAIGLRNPWGMAFDEVTGKLWAADVGQDMWEEINCVKKGANYGWSDRDGPVALAVHPEPLLETASFTDPVFAYSRVDGDGICIIGGYRYRGSDFPELENTYLYGDWGYGLMEAIVLSGDETAAVGRMTLHRRGPDETFNPTFIGADTRGELLVLSQNGVAWRLERTGDRPLLTEESVTLP